jgi:hypothetical protein
MKKLLFSVIAITAFSLTSFGNEIENKNLATPIKMGVESELTNTIMDNECFDVTIKWVTSEPYFDEEYGVPGVAITVHNISFTWCW